MIKLLIFDFDGVLADLKEVHFTALNKALKEHGREEISRERHINEFDGLSTKSKLSRLGMPYYMEGSLCFLKQKFTLEELEKLPAASTQLKETLAELVTKYTLVVCSNAVRETVLTGLYFLGIDKLFGSVYSNEEVRNSKPHPETYIRAMADTGVSPAETLIFEDSRHGREAAYRSGAHVYGVDTPADLQYDKIMGFIEKIEETPTPWMGKPNTVVLVPMAGAGSRFKEKGYRLPKPLINVKGKPMIQRVVENLNMDAEYVFVVQKEHYEQYNLGVLLPLIKPGCKIVQTDGLTEGAACTTLLAREFINNDKHLIIANSDQLVEWDSCSFMYEMISRNCAGGILTFECSEPKYSYAKVKGSRHVTEVAEKNPISNQATVGIYYWQRGRDYVNCAEAMISKDVRVNNEFYVCPVFNELLQVGGEVVAVQASRFNGLGTPEDLERYLNERV